MIVLLKARLTLCLIFLLSFQVHSGFAQVSKFEAGYIVTQKGDSLNGYILIQDQTFNSRTCSFKEGTTSEIKTYSPSDLFAYGIGEKTRYVAYAIKSGETSEKTFISCLVKGKVSLFYFQERYFIDSAYGFQELTTSTTNITRDDKVYLQRLPVYKGVLQTALADCSTIHENLKTTSLKKNDLVKLFEDYHKCTGQPATVYESGAGKIKVALGMALSGQSSGFEINSEGHPSYLYIDNNDAMTEFSLAPTLVVEFYAPEGKGRFRARTGLSYFSGKYYVYDQGSPGTLDHELTIDMARIELPLLLKYYPIKNTGLYITAGLGLNVSVKWDQRSVTIMPPSTVISENSDLKNNSFFTNPMAGLGFDFPIGKHKIFIEGIYGQSKSVLSSTQAPSSKLNTLTFTTGFVF